MGRPSAADVASVAAAAARRAPGVVGLDAGPLGTRVTYGPRGRVAGITVRDDAGGGRRVSVHLCVAWGPVVATASGAQDAVLAALDAAFPGASGWRVDVDVADIVSLEDSARAAAGPATGPSGAAG